MGRTDDAVQTRRSGDAMLMGRVARRYYLRGQSKKEVAEALGISRFKVARLLDDARESGLVRIEIGSFGGIDIDLSTRLEDGLALSRCVVVSGSPSTPVAPPPELSVEQLARAAADVVGEVVVDGDVLGLPWSRTIHAMVGSLTTLPRVEVVQLCGDQAVGGTLASAVEVTARAARLSGGPAHVFFAPLVVDDEAAAVAFRRQPLVADALGNARRVTVAFVGIGAWLPGYSSIFDAVSDTEREAVAAEGAVGEISGVFYDDEGRTLSTSLTPRIVAVDGPTLASIPHVVGIAQGAAKAHSVLAAIRGGLLDGVVVDASLGEALAEAAGLGGSS